MLSLSGRHGIAPKLGVALIMVGAAAEQMHANSADVGGNNIPVNGGTYNADGLTVAEVLSTAGAPAAVAAAAPTATLAAADAGTHDAGTHDVAPPTVEIHHDAGQHFHHMWG